jgi:Zn-dependent peptidase ImmA (M78 family)
MEQRRRHLKREEIDAKAEEVALHFDPAAFTRKTSPIYEVLNGLMKRYDVCFLFDQQLGYSTRGRRILGRFDFDPRQILIDRILPYDSPRFRWTLCHEIGHLVLHRKLDRRLISKAKPQLVDTRVELRFLRTAAKTELEWIEWQANQFASSLLLPRPILYSALSDIQKQLEISRPGWIYLDDARHNLCAYISTLHLLAERLNVSRTMMRIRLLNLGILIDARPLHRDPIQEALRSLFSEAS